MAGPNIPGLNEQVMRQMMRQRSSRQNAPVNSPAGGLAEDEYMNYKKMATPAMKKMMWPSLALSLITDPSISGTFAKGAGMISPAAGKFLGAAGGNLGPLGALGYLGPKVISEGLKGRRHAYEKTQPRMGGMAGNTLKGLELASSIDYLMRLPGWASVLGGMSQKTLLGKSPRIANWLTGSAGSVMAGKGSQAVAGGGILSSLYSGLKTGADKLTRGQISSAMSNAAKKGGIGGAAASGAGLLDKGISGLLGSPMGVMMGMAGLQVGLSIYKSVKMAKLTPTRQAPDKYASKFYNPNQTNASLTKILTMNPAARDPQSMGFVLQQKTFMVQQLIVQELMRLNMQVAGFRGEYHTENDFVRQEKEKGEGNFSEKYGTDVYGEDDRGVIMRGLDKLSHTVTKAKNTFDPFTQLTNFAFGLLRGKMILPGTEVSKIAKIYGYDNESKMMKERSESFGTAMDQTRLLHTPGRSVLEMAQTYESKMMALGVAQFDLNRYMLAELMTIRISGYGISENILHRKEPGVFKQFMTDMFEKLNPMNLPGVNAIWNLGKAAIKGITSVPKLAEKMFAGAQKGIAGGISWLGGESYTSMRDDKELRKASGLEKDYSLRSQEYMAIGLPAIQAEMKQVQVEQLESLRNLVEIQTQVLEISGGGHAYQAITGKQGLLVWDSEMQRYLAPDELDKAKKGRRTKMAGVKEEAFKEGPVGKLMYMLDAFFNPNKAAGFGRGKARQQKYEDFMGGIEQSVFGKRKTLRSSKQVYAAEMPMTSLQPTTTTLESSPEAENQRRQFAYELTKKGQEILAGLGMTAIPALGAALISLPISGLIAVGASLSYLLVRFKQKKKVAEKMKATMGYATSEEEIFAKVFAEAGLSTADQVAKHGIGELGAGGRISGLPESPQNKMLKELRIIKSYLGDSKKNSIFTLLQPGTPDIAEVTIVDSVNKKPVFIGGDDPNSHMGTLYNIQDYMMNTQGDLLQAVAGGKAKGGPIDKNAPVLVGEEGPEILMPKSAGVIIPNNKIRKFGKGGLLDSLSGVLPGAHELSMQGKLGELEVKKEKKEDSDWKKDVVNLLSGILKKPLKLIVDKKEKEGGIWDFLKDNIGTILKGGGVLLTGLLGKFLWDMLSDETKESIKNGMGTIFKGIGGFLLDQFGEMSSFGKIGTFAIAGAGIGSLGGPIGIINGALIGAAVGGVVDSIYDMIAGYKKDGITGGLDGFLTGSISGEFASISGNTGKWVIAGAAIGSVVPVVGTLTGALVGGILGATFATIKNMILEGIGVSEKNGMLAGFDKFLTGSDPMEWSSVIGPAGKFALIGAAIGLPFFPPFGSIVGGIIGFLFGGIVGILKNLFVGGFKLWDKIKEKFLTNAEDKATQQINDELAKEATATQNGTPEQKKAFAERYKNKEKLIAERKLQLEKNNQQSWASSGTQQNIPTQVLSAEDKAWQAERSKITSIAERDAVDKKYGKGKFSNVNNAAPVSAIQVNKPQTSGGISGGIPPVSKSLVTSSAAQPSIIPTGGNVSVDQALREAEKTTGIPLDILTRIAYAESKLNPNAIGPKTKTGKQAKGLFQFMPGTWSQMIAGSAGKKHKFDQSTSIFDPRANALMGAELIKENEKYAKQGPGKGSVVDFYAMHVLGDKKGPKFLEAIQKNPNQSITNVIPNDWIIGNESLFTNNGTPKSVIDVYKEIASRVSQPVSDSMLAKVGSGGVLSAGIDTTKSSDTSFIGTLTSSVSNIGKLIMDSAMKDFTDDGLKRGFTDKGLLKEAGGSNNIVGAVSPSVTGSKTDTQHAVALAAAEKGLGGLGPSINSTAVKDAIAKTEAVKKETEDAVAAQKTDGSKNDSEYTKNIKASVAARNKQRGDAMRAAEVRRMNTNITTATPASTVNRDDKGWTTGGPDAFLRADLGSFASYFKIPYQNFSRGSHMDNGLASATSA